MNKKTKKIIMIMLTVLLFLTIIPFVLCSIIYEVYFGKGYDTREEWRYEITDFAGLKQERYPFTSDDGQMLIGYKFYKEHQDIKGTLVFAHGLGCGGYNTYMDLINYFAGNGFFVFAYDATGHDESEGDSVHGIPQGVIDLLYAIDFVEENEDFQHLPVVLLGHSWGGYAVCNVLNEHPEVKAVVSMAGFNTSADLIKIECERHAGKIADIAVPYMKLYEKLRFGKYASDSALTGFEKSEACVMIVQSSDDTIVPPEYGYDIYYERYKDDDRFIFREYHNRAHKYVYSSEASMEYMKDIHSKLNEYEKSLDHKISTEEKVSWVNANLDRAKYAGKPDDELMGEILELYEKAIAGN